jgi:phosphoglycolate phosphatase-like HAD superfamily hydrolase
MILKFPNIKIFWDIDGTLLKTNGAAAAPFAVAVSNYLGRTVNINKKQFSGLTDYEIAIRLAEKIDISLSKTEVTQILGEYCKLLPSSLKSGNVEKVNDIQRTLNFIKTSNHLVSSIGSGNCIDGAKIKLAQVDLLKYFDLNNIYCSTEENWKRELIIEKAKKSLKINQIGLIIGDSPRDIEVAKYLDMKVIGVASGSHTMAELAEYEPNLVLNYDWNFDMIIKAIYQVI